MVYLERISHHFENGGRDEIRIILPAEFMGKMKLLNYTPHPNELRRGEFDKGLCQRTNKIQVRYHCSPL